MAQYGKNYYGASYYGLSGVFSGQFVSDQTILNTPLSSTSPADGKLYADLICAHPRITYTYPDSIFIRTGVWTENSTSDHNFTLQANLVSSSVDLNYVSGQGNAVINIEVQTYVSGELVNTQNLQRDTSVAGPYTITPSQYGEQRITITYSSGGSFTFTSLVAKTTDIKLEMRGKNGTWGNWTPLTLTASQSNISYNGFENVDIYSASTPNWNGYTGYQFKIILASSDTSNTPELININIHTASTADYSPAGYWKTSIDLTADISSIDTLEFDVVTPEGTSVEIRTRTSSIDGNWSAWSLPYSTYDYRATLNYKATPALTEGYIITPVVAPSNMTKWNNFLITHYINYMDTFSGVETPGSSILVHVVSQDYNALNPSQEHILLTFAYSDMKNIMQDISSITDPIRFMIVFKRNTGIASPAVEGVTPLSLSTFGESKTFGIGLNDFKGYGSAIFGDNTGIDKVYLDGLARSVEATVANLGFTIPESIKNPEYVIELDPFFSESYITEELNIYWHGTGTKKTTNANDYLMVRVKEATVPINVGKHYRYGSGIVISVEPEYITAGLLNIFNPILDPARTYAYYLKNGFVLDNPNENLDIRWESENLTPAVNRRNITYDFSDSIYIGIITGTTKGLIDWISEEKIFEAIVNPNDVNIKYSTTITDLPQIAPQVIVNTDPSILPYEVAIVEGSVESHGERKPEERLTGIVRYLVAADGTPSLVETTEIKSEVVRGSGNSDYLPKAMIRSITGIYSSADDFSPYYTSGTDYDFVLPQDGTYSNRIDWSKGIAGSGGAKAPSEGDTYYVTYIYDKVTSLRIEFTSNYTEYEPIMQIYRSPVLERTGECSPSFDYKSSVMSFDDFYVPEGIDRSTLRYIVYDSNSRVRTYIQGNYVIGTLDSRDPKECWNPKMLGGTYYVNKQDYYMFTNEQKYSLDSSIIPVAQDIAYEHGHNENGVLIQKGTHNLLTNSTFKTGTLSSISFSDTFERQA